MAKATICLAACLMTAALPLQAKEYHVSKQGCNTADGSAAHPLLTINAAAQLALPGDTVTVHGGTYREWVNPLNGGDGPHKRILYRAAEGERVYLKGSEVVKGWKRVPKTKGTWMATVPNGHTYHTGDVYLNDVSLYEVEKKEQVLTPDTIRSVRDPQGTQLVWYAEVDAEKTTLYAHFGNVDPNKEMVEISVRPTCFYPTRQGLDYITFRGFHVSQAATRWAAPTAEQVGMVSTHWCKGWIIEHNVIRNSRSCGITLGMARESMVLLKNDRQFLPLNEKKIKRIAVIGPNADNEATPLGNYNGTPLETVTPLKGLKRRLGNRVAIDYYPGTGIVAKLKEDPSLSEVAKAAGRADIIIFVGGLTADYEGEAGDAGAGGYAGFASGDRTTLDLPPVQIEMLKALKKTGKPLVVVNMSGSTMTYDWESRNATALIQAWYGGQAIGDALADVLFGTYSPSGRMPLTAYCSDDDLSPFESYSMENRTYRYFKGDVRYPFGYGLNYTTFGYSALQCNEAVNTGEDLEVSVKVKNTGKREGDEVAQLYLSHPQDGNIRRPICALKGFRRVHLQPGEEQTITFRLTPEDLALTEKNGNLTEAAGQVKIFIGGGQPKYTTGCTTDLTIYGEPYQVQPLGNK